MKKKIFAIVLCVAMLAVAVVGGTMAYFTDADEKTNTFTVGSVEIELIESQYHREVDKAEGTSQLSDDAIKADAETYQDEYLAVHGRNIVPGVWVRKAPYIVNTGNSPAYVRVRLLVPTELFTSRPKLDIMVTTTAVLDGSITNPVAAGSKTIDNIEYNEYIFTYLNPLAPSEMTYWPAFWQFRMSTDCDNEHIDAFIESGVLTEDGEFNVLVQADAIQSEGFADAAAAFAAFDAQ